ncbi:hypothetical protein RhiirA5_427867 [Rhizophagus irregularis]|uniref:ATPase AAA-type core domain-containing protein n=1 Tax=Rhizophagus irregularis TaxID=588596 RepID=A0A2N0P1F1_9GLOM|nr:hypothetical protein RhiirA5_427867 [Rhizophagus irregularis]
MVESYNCLRLDNSYVFQFGKPDVLNLWQIDVYESKLNPNSTEDDIKNLGELEKKRPFTEVEEKLSEPLLNNIQKGEFMALHGVRATGKTTRVFRVMEQLEGEGYLCLFFSFKRSQVPDSKILFWTTFSDYLVRTAPEHIEDQIKSSNDFVNLFSKRWEKKVILFIDEYDIMYRANNETISLFLRIVRNIKARKEGYAIWSINSRPLQYLASELKRSMLDGLVINCGKAIDEKLKKGLGENDISIWLKAIICKK